MNIHKKGNVKKLNVSPLTLESSLVSDGLEAVSLLTSKEPIYLVGGIATQSYLPEQFRRPTSDIDISVVKPLNYDSFKYFVRDVSKSLLDYGYSVRTQKNSRSFALYVEDENEDKLLIEFSRRNEKSFNKNKNKLERELSHANKKALGDKGSVCYVSSPEDIIVPKLVRCVGSLERNPIFKKNLPKKRDLDEEYIKGKLSLINRGREHAMLKPGDLEVAERLRFVSDVYDMSLLYKYSGINEKYLSEVMKEWDTLSGNNKNKDFLLNFVFYD